jgi:hypothetical protein
MEFATVRGNSGPDRTIPAYPVLLPSCFSLGCGERPVYHRLSARAVRPPTEPDQP